MNLEEAFKQVAATEAGRAVLSHLLTITGYAQPIITYDPATRETNPITTVYHTGRRDVWLDVRRYLSWQDAARIENPEPEALGELEGEQDKEDET